MGSHNIFPILHNDHALQHSKRFLQNNPWFIFPGWWKCVTFIDNTYDEVTIRQDYKFFRLMLADELF